MSTPAAPVAVIFALDCEAAVFRKRVANRCDVKIYVSGAGRRAARVCVRRALSATPQPRWVIAAGFCGALRPHLRAGDIVTGSRIVTTDSLIASPQAKRELAAATNADAVDMESAAIVAECARRQVPCQVIRAVVDTSQMRLDPELLACLAAGRVRLRRLVGLLLRRPQRLIALAGLGWAARRAAYRLADALRAAIDAAQAAANGEGIDAAGRRTHGARRDGVNCVTDHKSNNDNDLRHDNVDQPARHHLDHLDRFAANVLLDGGVR